MESIVRILRNLGPVRVSAIGGVAIVSVLFFLFLAARLSTPSLGRLYGNLSESDSQEIVAFLAAQEVSYQVQMGGREIYVPATELTSLRMSLAAEGLPRQATFGNELFNNLNTVGMSSFMQEVTRNRALEGELARTIIGLDTISGARVHVVHGTRELFSREQTTPTATVFLTMYGASRLSRDQVLAVQHLVASAVEDLLPNKVAIVDERGNLLSGDSNPNSIASTDDARLQYETRLATRIEELIERTVGYGKVRAQVSADMDFSTTTLTEELYNPELSVLRSTETVDETTRSSDLGPNVVGVLGNTPEGNSAFGDQGTSEQTNRTEERSNYEVTKQERSQIQAPGRVNQLSVAVLVDGTYVTGDDGSQIYQPRSNDQMDSIRSLIQSAVGYRVERGDTVEVVNMPFAPIPTDSSANLSTLFGFTMDQVSRLIEVLLLTLFGVLVIILLLRPLITRIFEATPQAIVAAGASQESDLSVPPGAIVTETADGRRVIVTRDGTTIDASGVDSGDMVSIAKVDGQVSGASIKQINNAIDSDPEAAVSVIRGWLFADQTAGR